MKFNKILFSFFLCHFILLPAVKAQSTSKVEYLRSINLKSDFLVLKTLGFEKCPGIVSSIRCSRYLHLINNDNEIPKKVNKSDFVNKAGTTLYYKLQSADTVVLFFQHNPKLLELPKADKYEKSESESRKIERIVSIKKKQVSLGYLILADWNYDLYLMDVAYLNEVLKMNIQILSDQQNVPVYVVY